MIRKPEVGCEAFFRLPSCKTISPIFLTIYPRIIGYSVCLQESSVPPVPAMFIYYLCKNRMSCFIWMNSVRADQGRIFHPVQHPAPHVFQSAASTTGNITYNIELRTSSRAQPVRQATSRTTLAYRSCQREILSGSSWR